MVKSGHGTRDAVVPVGVEEERYTTLTALNCKSEKTG